MTALYLSLVINAGWFTAGYLTRARRVPRAVTDRDVATSTTSTTTTYTYVVTPSPVRTGVVTGQSRDPA